MAIRIGSLWRSNQVEAGESADGVDSPDSGIQGTLLNLSKVGQMVSRGLPPAIANFDPAHSFLAVRADATKPIEHDGPITAELVQAARTQPYEQRHALHEQAALELYRLFSHPQRDAGLRSALESWLGAEGVGPEQLAEVGARPEIPLREEDDQRRQALLLLLSAKKLPADLLGCALLKLAECGTADDVGLIQRVARKQPQEIQMAAQVAEAGVRQAAQMTIVLAAFESKPYVNGGGLGNVMKELPPALARQGHRVIVVLPRHGNIDADQLADTGEVGVVYGPKTEKFGLLHNEREGVDYFFIENDTYYSNRDGIYKDSYGDYGDTFERYDFFGAALPVAIRHILKDQAPDVVQLNDAHTATAATYLKNDPVLRDAACVMAIHNLGTPYQGRYGEEKAEGSRLDGMGLYYPAGPAEAWGQVNLLKLGLVESDGAITVSRQYMNETLSQDGGEGLDGVLQGLRDEERLWGNLNGIDNNAWNSETDPLLPANFTFEDQSGKAACKASLQTTYGLAVEPDVPLVGVVARITNQKGIDDIAGAVRSKLEAGEKMQLVVCGEGQSELQEELRRLQADFPESVVYDAEFASDKEHTILGGSDLFLMPSRFEPCGLPQMYALRYLTVPIVRAVGGLEESIDQYDPNTGTGTGFKFKDDLGAALTDSLAWYEAGAESRQDLLQNCADADFSWDSASAPEQLAFYRRIIHQKTEF